MKNFKVKKFSFGQRTLLVIVLIFFIFISPFTVAKAHAWMAVPAAIIKHLLEIITKYIEQIIVAVLKTVGATVISQLSTALVTGGNNGKSMVITDWTKLLQTGPAQKGKVAVTALIDQATRGKGSSSQYRTRPGTEGIGPNAYNPGVGAYSNYATMAAENVKSKTVAASQPQMTMEASPASVYDDGNMKQADEMYTELNSAVAFDIEAAEAESIAAGDARELAKLKATSGGVSPLEDENGNTIAPASVVSDILSGSMNLGNNMLASAKDIPGVLTALATKLVSETFTKGLGNLAAKVNKQITGVKSQSSAQVKAQVNTSGPAKLYKN